VELHKCITAAAKSGLQRARGGSPENISAKNGQNLETGLVYPGTLSGTTIGGAGLTDLSTTSNRERKYKRLV
jgi:hypothetical protein